MRNPRHGSISGQGWRHHSEAEVRPVDWSANFLFARSTSDRCQMKASSGIEPPRESSDDSARQGRSHSPACHLLQDTSIYPRRILVSLALAEIKKQECRANYCQSRYPFSDILWGRCCDRVLQPVLFFELLDPEDTQRMLPLSLIRCKAYFLSHEKLQATWLTVLPNWLHILSCCPVASRTIPIFLLPEVNRAQVCKLPAE